MKSIISQIVGELQNTKNRDVKATGEKGTSANTGQPVGSQRVLTSKSRSQGKTENLGGSGTNCHLNF